MLCDVRANTPIAASCLLTSYLFLRRAAVEQRLRLVDTYLQEFEARSVDSSVNPQPLFKVGVASRLCLHGRSGDCKQAETGMCRRSWLVPRLATTGRFAG